MQALENRRRVDHPMRYWSQWSQSMLDEKLQEIHSKGDVHIVAIGHSMGGAALLQYEVDHPGTFDGFIGFEPIYDNRVLTEDQVHGARDMLVSVSLAREGEWATRELAVEHIKNHKAFRRWHPEALEAYVNSAIVPVGDVYKLAMTPEQEAAAFCHEFIQFTPEILARVQCRLFFEHAERSFFFFPQSAHALAAKLDGKLVVGALIPQTSHLMVHEDPDVCAQRIVEDLSQLPLVE